MSFFGRNKKSNIDTDPIVKLTTCADQQQVCENGARTVILEPTGAPDDMAKDLAVLVGNAITIWAQKYHLENLPRDIILDQAVSIINAVKSQL